eukprot:4536070-Amphidinium_carterae.1
MLALFAGGLHRNVRSDDGDIKELGLATYCPQSPLYNKSGRPHMSNTAEFEALWPYGRRCCLFGTQV